MEKVYADEKWKSVIFDFAFVNETRVEISNFGRVKTYNRVFNGNILKGSTINGYNIIRLKFFKERESSVQNEVNELQGQIAATSKKLKELKLQEHDAQPGEPGRQGLAEVLLETSQLLKKQNETLRQRVLDDRKARTIHYHALIHRLVAEYFIPQPSPAHTVVAHIDYDKSNNRTTNLKWMTPEENYQHQRFSPNAIASKTHLEGRRKEEARSTKMTVTKVMLLKKLLNEGKPMKQLVKQFRITETQILRIKKGINWSEIPPAP